MPPITRRAALAGGAAAAGFAAGAAVDGAAPFEPARLTPASVGEQVSWLRFLPEPAHAAVLDGTSTADLTAPLQRMLDTLPPGARVFAPGRVNFEGTLTIRRSLTLFGAAGRENMDNSWDGTGEGTQLIHRGGTGDALVVEATRPGNGQLNIVLRDLLIRGARLDDRGRPDPAARSGRGLVVAGNDDPASNIRLEIDNVHVAQAVDAGVDLSGSVFGGSLRNMFIHRNGGNGLRARGSGAGIGEMWLARLRVFQNGWNGTRDEDRAGVLWRAGTFLASQLSASENRGPGLMLGGGPARIDALQLESNGHGVADPAARRQAVIGLPGAGVRSAMLTGIMSAPGPGYRGAHFRLSGNAHNVQLAGYLADTLGPGGRHLERERGAEGLDMAGLGGCTVVVDRSTDVSTRADVRVFARGGAAGGRTGDGAPLAWRPIDVLRNDFAAYDPATGAFTAPLSGMYEVEASIPLVGLDASHAGGELRVEATGTPRVRALGNLGAMRDARDGGYAVEARARVLMAGGDRVRLVIAVSGGARVVAASGDPTRGFLTVRLA